VNEETKGTEMNPKFGTNVSAALVNAQGRMKAVGKDASVSFGNKYAYVSAEAMIGACREALNASGLALSRSGVRFVEGTESRADMIVCEYQLIHLSGEVLIFAHVPWFVLEMNGRPIDKALAGALTASLSYFLRDLLLVPKCDESDMDKRDDTKHEAGTLGVTGAVALRKRLAEAGLETAELLETIRSKGINIADDLAMMPKDLLPRVSAWILKRKKDSLTSSPAAND